MIIEYIIIRGIAEAAIAAPDLILNPVGKAVDAVVSKVDTVKQNIKTSLSQTIDTTKQNVKNSISQTFDSALDKIKLKFKD